MDVIREFRLYYDNSFKEALPREISENYDILECLSHTEECDTLLVEEKTSGTRIVAKCYVKNSQRYDTEELAQLRNLKNDAIPRYVGEYKNEEFCCVLREYMEGVSLNEYVRNNSLTEDNLIELAIRLAEAMKVLHDAEPSIIHRDIKPENIIIKEDGGVALIDLGVSRVFKEGGDSDTVFCGTENFAPPEQYGFMQTDIRSDIYSFGVVLSWLLTEKAKPIQKPVTKLERVAAKCCEFAPNKRYRDDRALLLALHCATDRYRRRRRIRIIAAAVLFLVLSAGIEYRQSLRDRAYIFREPLIEEAVRAVLNKPDGIITASDLEAVTGVFIQGERVYHTQDVFYAEGQEWYNIIGYGAYGPITDLSDLENMPNLSSICIGGNHVRDLAPLKNLEHLQHIELRNNDIQDISPLEGKREIENACLRNNPLTGIEAVRTWSMLTGLDLGFTGSYDASLIGDLKSLSRLDINNDSDAWQYLDGLYVRELFIKASGQTDLECLRGMPYIQRLYICNSQIRDISALEGREDIVYLNLNQSVMDDLSPLFTMPNLATVEMSVKGREQMEELISVYGEPPFEVIYIS